MPGDGAPMKKGTRLKTTSSMVIACIILIAIWALFFCCSVPTLATEYYVPQINFAEKTVPIAKYHWHFDRIDGCIYKEPGIPNSYYVWTKLQVQSWRNALREYTGNHDSWTITGRYINNVAALQPCPLKFYILKSYKEFPGYPQQTGSYTSVDYNQN